MLEIDFFYKRLIKVVRLIAPILANFAGCFELNEHLGILGACPEIRNLTKSLLNVLPHSQTRMCIGQLMLMQLFIPMPPFCLFINSEISCPVPSCLVLPGSGQSAAFISTFITSFSPFSFRDFWGGSWALARFYERGRWVVGARMGGWYSDDDIFSHFWRPPFCRILFFSLFSS